MFEVGMYEAKTHFPAIMRRVEQGEDCIITRRGKPVGRINSIAVDDKKKIGEAWMRIRALSKKYQINATLEEMIAWKNEGRR